MILWCWRAIRAALAGSIEDEVGILDGTGDQPGEDAGGESEEQGASLDFLGFTFRYDRRAPSGGGIVT